MEEALNLSSDRLLDGDDDDDDEFKYILLPGSITLLYTFNKIYISFIDILLRLHLFSD